MNDKGLEVCEHLEDTYQVLLAHLDRVLLHIWSRKCYQRGHVALLLLVEHDPFDNEEEEALVIY